MTTAAAKATAAWDGLNARQRAYLRCLYQLDQDDAAGDARRHLARGGACAYAPWSAPAGTDPWRGRHVPAQPALITRKPVIVRPLGSVTVLAESNDASAITRSVTPGRGTG